MWSGRRVLITGGLGFIGSNLARHLSSLGARVRVLDALIPNMGGNPANLEGADVEVEIGDVRDAALVMRMLESVEFVFHLAGAGSHTRSMTEPFDDLDLNCRATLVLLESRRRSAPNSVLVYSASRSQYGLAGGTTVTEEQPLRPVDVNGVNKSAAEMLIRMYDRTFGHSAVSLRLGNVFGPRHQMRHAEQGFLHWFIRQALEGQTLRVFGGAQRRDFIYVDDVVRAMVAAATCTGARSEIINVASGTSVSVLEAARIVVEIAGSGHLSLEQLPLERAAIEIGDFTADISKAARLLGWRPTVSFRDGLFATITYYRAHRELYWK